VVIDHVSEKYFIVYLIFFIEEWNRIRIDFFRKVKIKRKIRTIKRFKFTNKELVKTSDILSIIDKKIYNI
jgi:hypothetical protein